MPSFGVAEGKMFVTLLMNEGSKALYIRQLPLIISEEAVAAARWETFRDGTDPILELSRVMASFLLRQEPEKSCRNAKRKVAFFVVPHPVITEQDS